MKSAHLLDSASLTTRLFCTVYRRDYGLMMYLRSILSAYWRMRTRGTKSSAISAHNRQMKSYPSRHRRALSVDSAKRKTPLCKLLSNGGSAYIYLKHLIPTLDGTRAEFVRSVLSLIWSGHKWVSIVETQNYVRNTWLLCDSQEFLQNFNSLRTNIENRVLKI